MQFIHLIQRVENFLLSVSLFVPCYNPIAGIDIPLCRTKLCLIVIFPFGKMVRLSGEKRISAAV